MLATLRIAVCGLHSTVGHILHFELFHHADSVKIPFATFATVLWAQGQPLFLHTIILVQQRFGTPSCGLCENTVHSMWQSVFNCDHVDNSL